MNTLNFKIDREKCVHCGKCIEDCVSGVIDFDNDNFPTIKDENSCIHCQHCLSICPVGALSIFNKNPKESEIKNNFSNPDELLNLMKTRKSFRHYRHENLDKYTLGKLKELLKYPPTGCNSHSLHISIIEDIEVMDKFRELANSKVAKIFKTKNLDKLMNKFSKYKDAFLNGEDIIFREAPHMIVVSSPITAPCASVDPIINLSYFELLAQSMGVGTLWCGFAQMCLKVFPELCSFIGVPDGYKPVYVMLFGPTDIKYPRSSQPEKYKIYSVTGENSIKISFIQRLKRLFWNFIR